MTHRAKGNRDVAAARVERLEPREMFYAGQPDPTFGIGGLSIGTGPAFHVLADGSILTARGIGAQKLRADGVVDTTFGSGGAVVHATPGSFIPEQFAVAGDGRIYLGGTAGFTTNLGVDHIFVARLRADGSLDPTFAGDGVYEDSFVQSFQHVNAILPQRDGSAFISVTRNQQQYLARLTRNGVLDTSFGTQGFVPTPAGVFAQDAQGRFLGSGGTGTGFARITRYLPTGQVDSTFGVNGNADLPAAGLTDVTIQPDGRIVYAGYTSRTPEGNDAYNLWYYVGRITADGQPDPTFRPFEGKSTNSHSETTHVLVQPDGRILLTGLESGSVNIFRLLPDGRLDSTFGKFGGRDEAYVGEASVVPRRPALLPDGRVLVGFTGDRPGIVRFLNAAGPATYGFVTGGVYEDANSNGARDAGEGGLSGRYVYVDVNGNGTFERGEPTDQTDADGRYELNGLAVGSATVRQIVPERWVGTTTGGTVAVVAGQTTAGPDFGQRPPPPADPPLRAITGSTNRNRIVWLDLDNDAVLDANEPSRRGDYNGNYRFDDLAPGTYRVRLVPIDGWRHAQPPNDAIVVDLTADADAVAGRPYTERIADPFLGGVAGNTYYDSNGNGVRNPGEPMLAGRTVYLDLNGNAQPDANEPTAVTNRLGSYRFDDLAPGTYVVRQVLPAGWQQTAPANGAGVSFTVVTYNQIRGADLASAPVNKFPAATASAPAGDAHQFSLTFAADPQWWLTADDVVVRPAGGGAAVVPAWVAYEPATRRATFGFAAPLADGAYEATLSTPTATGTAQTVFAFRVLRGDANGDQAVNFDDLLALAQSYNGTAGRAWADGDFNGDERVDFDDLLMLAQRYNTGAAPAAAALASVTVAARPSATKPAAATVKAVAKPAPAAPPFNVAKPIKAPAKRR